MDDRARMIEAWRAREVPDAQTRARMLARLGAPVVSRTTVIAFGLAMAIAATVLLAIAGVGRLLPRRLAERNDQAVHDVTPPREQQLAAPPVASPPRPVAPAPVTTPTSQRKPAPRPDAPARPLRPASSVAEEGRLLAAAQAALRDGDPHRALGELAAHAKRFPAGTMTSEREALRVIALCGTDRRDEGVRASTAVLGDASAASYAPRIRRACGL